MTTGLCASNKCVLGASTAVNSATALQAGRRGSFPDSGRD